MSPFFIMLSLFFAPLVPLIIYGRWKTKRKNKQTSAEANTTAKPFHLNSEAAPGLFLRRFTRQQRAFLRPQLSLAKIFSVLLAWFYAIVFSGGLLPDYVNEYGTQPALAQRVWFSYLDQLSSAGIYFAILAVFAGIFASTLFTNSREGSLYLTRPLPRRFLFWGRIGAAAASLVGAMITGLAISFVLLLLFYGPVWRHLTDTTSPVRIVLDTAHHQRRLVINMKSGMTTQQIQHFVQGLQTSAPRIFLSLITTAILVFSLMIALSSQPFGGFLKLPSRLARFPISVIFATIVGAFIRTIHRTWFSHAARTFFVYTHLGPPASFLYALVPISISIALLFAAQFFLSRIELTD